MEKGSNSSNRLREWRLEHELTLQDVEDLSGFDISLLSRLERGERGLRPLLRVRLARSLRGSREGSVPGVTTTTAALLRAANLLGDRLAQLEERITGGDETVWPDYCAVAVALSQLAASIAPGANGRLLSTRELAESMNVSTRQVRRLKASGKIAPAAQLGPRTLRWRAEAWP